MKKEISQNLKVLKANSYPGRGIVVGKDQSGNWMIIYWLMGRSQNSRNRVLLLDKDVVKTKALDDKKVEHQDLVIYSALKEFKHFQVISNGSQTDTIIDGLNQGLSFEESLSGVNYEPDEPNFTPRISALIDILKNEVVLSIIQKDQFSTDTIRRFYRFDNIPPGIGLCIHTYLEDENPLPSFNKNPFEVSLEGSGEEIAQFYWEILSKKNRVSLVVKKIAPAGRVEYIFKNIHA